MAEAVIVDSVRTPIGRAFKGSMKDLRPDETAAFVIDALLERNPAVDPMTVEDVYMGCGAPAGPAGEQHRPDRGAAVAAPAEHTNGVTISRYCASSLESIRLAANAVKAGEGDVYVAAGVEFVSRFTPAGGRAPRGPEPAPAGQADGEPDAYIAMGQTAENVAEATASRARTRTRTPSARRTARSRRRRTASSTARSSPSRCPTGPS